MTATSCLPVADGAETLVTKYQPTQLSTPQERIPRVTPRRKSEISHWKSCFGVFVLNELSSRITKTRLWSGVHKCRLTKFCTLAPDVRSTTACNFLPHIQVFISSHAPSGTRQATVRFTGHCRTVGPQDGTCFMSAFWRVEF
jgi:hypothetical protein